MGFSSPSSTTSEQLSNNANVEQIKLTRTESIPSDSDSDIEVVERPMEALEEAEHITELNKKSYDERNEPEKLETKEEQNYEESVEKMDFDESSS